MNRLFDHLRGELSQVYPVGEARAVAFWLMEEAFGVSRTDIYADKVRQFSQDERERLDNMCKQLVEDRRPVQYVVGHEWFLGRQFRVTSDVLIPRPETEELVNWAVEKTKKCQHPRPIIMDAGTGSGCIAVSLALALPEAEVSAIDLSEGALAVARENAEKLGARVHFQKADMLQPWDFLIQKEVSTSPKGVPPSQKMDIIVSNPPYICQREAAEMEQNVLRNEPHTALFVPDDDPLRFYRALAREAMLHLRPEGWLLVEINRAYGHETAHLFEEMGLKNVEIRKDSFGNERMVAGQRA